MKIVNFENNLSFLITTYIVLLKQLDTATKGLWGKMNAQQMIEHMSDSVREANGKTLRTLVTPEENLPSMKEF